MQRKIKTVFVFTVLFVFGIVITGYTQMTNTPDNETPGVSNTSGDEHSSGTAKKACRNQIDFKSDKIKIDLAEDGTGEFEVKNVETPYMFVINTTTVKAISFEGEGKWITLSGAKDSTFEIRDKKGTSKKVSLAENSKCDKQDVKLDKTFKVVSAGASPPKTGIINTAGINAFGWDKENVFFADAKNREAVRRNLTVQDKTGKELDYNIFKNELIVIPNGKVFIAPREDLTFTIKGGTPPYHVTSNKPSVIGAISNTTADTFTVKNATEVGGSATLTFWDSTGKNKQDVQVDITSDGTEPEFVSDHLLINLSVAFLNPYIINASTSTDANGKSVHELQNNGQVDTNYYVEVIYKDRNAWMNDPREKDSYTDFEARIAYGIEKSEKGNTITGASYGDISLGYSFLKNRIEKDNCQEGKVGTCIWNQLTSVYKGNNKLEPQKQRFTANLEYIYGFATDQKFLMMHRYYGLGVVFVYGLELSEKQDRIMEALVGAYRGRANVPVLDEDDHNFVKDDNGKPMFREPRAWLLRADFRIPVRQDQYLSLSGRYFFIDGRNNIDPWNITASVSFRLDKLVDGILGMVDEVL